MLAVHDEICRLANKISLLMDFIATAKDDSQLPEVILSSFESSFEILNRLDPSKLRLYTEQLLLVFSSRANELTRHEEKWSDYVVSECERLHTYGLHEKSIKQLGSILSAWDCRVCSYDQFAGGLDRLFELVETRSTELIRFLGQRPTSPDNMSNAAAFSLANNSLAVVVGGISQVEKSGDPKDILAATTVSFGCTMFNRCVDSFGIPGSNAASD